MAQILLISANVTRDPYPVYPLGMASVAGDVRAHGHEVQEWDILVEGESADGLVNCLKTKNPEIIGVSLRNVDNCSSGETVAYWRHYQELVQTIRSVSTSPVVLGGPGYSLFPEILLEKTGADYGITGEGEGIFAQLIDDLLAGKTPAARIVRNGSPLMGDKIRAPERNKKFADYYLKQGGMLNIQTKRGCPFTCSYCSYPALEGREYRYRPARDVVDELEMLINSFGLNYYFIADSVFNDSAGRYLEVVEEITRRGITVSWMGYFRPQRFTREEVSLLKQSGLSAVEWGTDCSTDHTLEGMGKSFSWSEVEHSNGLFTEAGIPCAHFIIFGGPGETEKTTVEGLSNIARLEHCVVFASTGVRVIPGTPLHLRAVKDGLLSPDRELLDPFFYFSPDITPGYLHKAITRAFDSRMDRVYPVEKELEKVRAFHKLGYSGPVWDLLLRKRRRRGGGIKN